MSIKKPFCLCLHEIENKLPRTKFCFKPCLDQLKMNQEKIKEEKKTRK